MKKMFAIHDTWFYGTPHPLLRFLTIYINGDVLVILPSFIVIGFLGFFSLRFMFLVYGLFYSLRALGEMIYWLLQQFGSKKYRPYDYGFKNLSNGSIYIIYQLTSLMTTLVALSFVFGILLYWS